MESNLFVANDLLKQQVENLKSQIESYEKLIKSYEEENKNKLQKLENTKNYAKTYFQEKTKNKKRYCSACGIDVKCSSYCNHIKSKVHIQNENKLKN